MNYGKYLWISRKMWDAVHGIYRCGKCEEFYETEVLLEKHPRRHGYRTTPTFKYMAENGGIYETVCVTEKKDHGTKWDDIWTPGRIIGEFGTSYPKTEADTLLAIAFGIWQETGLRFEYHGPGSLTFEGHQHLGLREDELTVMLTDSFTVSLAEPGSMERVIEAIKQDNEARNKAA